MNRPIVILMLACLSSFYATAQLPLKTVVEKYSSFKSALPPARLHLVLNQDKYAPGDTILVATIQRGSRLSPVRDEP